MRRTKAEIELQKQVDDCWKAFTENPLRLPLEPSFCGSGDLKRGVTVQVEFLIEPKDLEKIADHLGRSANIDDAMEFIYWALQRGLAFFPAGYNPDGSLVERIQEPGANVKSKG
jgi:hypothetical protein